MAWDIGAAQSGGWNIGPYSGSEESSTLGKYVFIGGSWRPIGNIMIYVEGSWRQVGTRYLRDNNQWKETA